MAPAVSSVVKTVTERHLDKIQPYDEAKHGQRVKDECIYSFDTPVVSKKDAQTAGVYISLLTYGAVSYRYLKLYEEKSGSTVFLHWRLIKGSVS